MRILGLIPARGGSKGIPNKNRKLLSGKPLIQYTSDVALQCEGLTKVVLSSDDDKIMELGKSLGLEVPFKRPSDLSLDTTPTLPVIIHALSYYEKLGEYFDAVCLLQVTSPFRTVDFVSRAIHLFQSKKVDSLISVLRVPHEFNPHWTFKESSEGLLKISTGEENIIPRRQELPNAYFRDGSIYITKVSVLKEQESLFGKRVSYVESDENYYVNIDTMKDWHKAEHIINTLKI